MVMMRKLFFNLVAAYLFFPLFIFIKDLIVIRPEYYRHNLDRSSLVEYLVTYINFYLDIVLPTLFLIFALIPFQLIKDYRYNKSKKGIVLWKKCLILSGLIAFWFAVLLRPPITNMGDRVILFGSLLAIGTLCALMLYFVVDRYVEKGDKAHTQDNEKIM